MTRLILAAGVAALAIASAAAAKPGGGGGSDNPHNGGGGQPAAQGGGNGGGHGHGGGGGGGGAAPAFAGGGGGGGHGHGHGGGFAAPRQQGPTFAGGGDGGGGRGHGHGGQAVAVGGGRGHGHGGQAVAFSGGGRAHGHGGQAVAFGGGGHSHGNAGGLTPEQGRGFARQQERVAQQAARGNAIRPRQVERGVAQDANQAARVEQAQRQLAVNNPVVAERVAAFRNADTSFAGNGARGLIDGCPPGLWMKNNGCLPPGQAAKLLGAQVASAASIASLYALPQSLNYLYPDTPDYYYRYGDSYLYQVDRGTNLIDALLPLIGGYVPGQYLPQPYMASYVPDYYGFNAFYPDYDGLCNRYGDGVIYQVDCVTGYVEDVIPLYASGYGVGQILPSAYNYYNVPMQYRSMYYDTPDYGYWYAPGAIYQYDQRSSLITSVAALMSPGFTIGQQLPLGYDVYNVPYAYRTTYYDTPTAWYRYNNGYIYQVDPATQLVTAIVASLLT